MPQCSKGSLSESNSEQRRWGLSILLLMQIKVSKNQQMGQRLLLFPTSHHLSDEGSCVTLDMKWAVFWSENKA